MEIPDSERPEALQAAIRELLGVRPFKAAPEGFDPIKASPRQLLAHGYPARPDAKRQPKLHDQWTSVLSRPIKLIEPRFAVMTDKARGSRYPYGLPIAGNGWCGSTAFAPKDDSVTFVSGQWTVPHIVAPVTGDCIVANWIGIDGANGDPNGNDSYDILQAGTTQLIDYTEHWYGDSNDYLSFVWFEWYPAPPVEITNLKVSPGDVMYCVICVYSPTEAGIHLLNTTTRLGVSFTKTAPGKAKLVGNVAEWVIEAPPSANMRLARFGDIYFDECIAGTAGGHLLTAGDGVLLPMYDPTGHIAEPELETDLLLKIRYTDKAP